MSDKDDIFAGAGDDDNEDFSFGAIPQPNKSGTDDISSFGFDDDDAFGSDPAEDLTGDSFTTPPMSTVDTGAAFDKDLDADDDPFGEIDTAPVAAAPVEQVEDDPFGNSAPPEEEEVDVMSAMGGVDDSEQDNDVFDTSAAGTPFDTQAEPAYVAKPEGGNKVVKYGIYGLGSLAAVAIAVVGFNMFAPVLMGGDSFDEYDIAAVSPDIPQIAASPSLPAQTATPSLPPRSMGGDVGGIDLPAGVQVAGGSDFEVDPINGKPAASALKEPSLPQAGDLPQVGKTPDPLFGNSGDVDAGLSEEIAKLSTENEQLRKELGDLAERLAKVEGITATPGAVPMPVAQPPAKPKVVEDWRLKGTQGEVAWIDGPGGFKEVRPGTEIDGVGTVEDITRYEDSWVVTTTAGIILQ